MSGWTALAVAAEKSKTQVVEALLKKVNINQAGVYTNPTSSKFYIQLPLALTLNLLKVRICNIFFLSLCTPLQLDGSTALIHASLNGRLGVVEALLKVHGLDVNHVKVCIGYSLHPIFL